MWLFVSTKLTVRKTTFTSWTGSSDPLTGLRFMLYVFFSLSSILFLLLEPFPLPSLCLLPLVCLSSISPVVLGNLWISSSPFVSSIAFAILWLFVISSGCYLLYLYLPCFWYYLLAHALHYYWCFIFQIESQKLVLILLCSKWLVSFGFFGWSVLICMWKVVKCHVIPV